jgi:UDP-glucose 4-epimerase
MKNIIVTGGLGFIGSHTVVELTQQGYHPIIVDNLSNSNLSVLHNIEKITGKIPAFYRVDVNNREELDAIFEKTSPDAVIHFAAFKAVGESVSDPLKYYHNNVGGLISLLQVMKKHQCHQLVFSSSCTVYGQPNVLPVAEDAPVAIPFSPYGNTKKIGEEILMDTADIKTVSLRYFNPIGAHPSGLIGELPIGVPGNLVPFITQTAAGIREQLTIHGKDYPTPDGTCIRDYLHVCDLAEAHILALHRFDKSDFSEGKGHIEVFNLGTGRGNSVKEVVDTFEKVSGLTLKHVYGVRRPGDIEQVWADPSKAMRVLGWKTKRNLEEMLESAWQWQKNLGQSNA